MPILSHVHRALVLDDEHYLAGDMQEFLTGLGCQSTIAVARVEDALLALEVGVQFATLDVGIGGQPCVQVAMQLSAGAVPFIYVSGYQRDYFPEMPDAPWVTKPATEDQLVEAISAALQKTSRAADAEAGVPS